VQDPGNTGAVIRSAAAAGATGVVVDDATADPWGWKALRASTGSVFQLPVVRTRSLAATIGEWQSAGVTVLAAVPRDGTSMYDTDLSRPIAILMGGEGPGLPVDIIHAAGARVTIPMDGGVESLNVAVAAALILYEARRQRTR
jgi:TrmH family RNA methyltransferase